MKKRTFGWVQNPGDLKNLKKVVSIFLSESGGNRWLLTERLPLLKKYKLISQDNFDIFSYEMQQKQIEVDYSRLKGKGSGAVGRSYALCTGIIQAVIDGQQKKYYKSDIGNPVIMKKPYTDDWTAEGYLRWAISCGLLEYNAVTDTCQITDLGRKLADTPDGSQEEKDALTIALLSYPPVIRVLSLLKENDNQTKFDLGSKLGFKGEMGFTSIPLAVYLCDYCEAASAKEKSEVRSNDEGDSDKYARGIASWCMQMGWVESSRADVQSTYRGHTYTAKLQTYSITRAGEKALLRAKGNSSNRRLPRIVMFEMLASNRTHGSDYLRYQRAALIKVLSSARTLAQLQNGLAEYDIDISNEAIKDHIEGLRAIGIDITFDGEKYKLHDRIECLRLPRRSDCVKDSVNDIADRVRERLVQLDHKYLALIDLAYSDSATKSGKNADAREFEIMTADLLTNELSFDGMRLGGSNRPDIIISHGSCGTIIDNKSYKDGFNVNAGCRDEMSRYVKENFLRDDRLNPNKWWDNFDTNTDTFTFLFVTSFLKGEYQKQLEYISASNSDIKGAAIGVESLLYLAEGIKNGSYSYEDFYNSFDNKEIVVN